MVLIVKLKTIKLKKKLYDFEIGKHLSYTSPKALSIKAKFDISDFFKIKHFCFSKNLMRKITVKLSTD